MNCEAMVGVLREAGVGVRDQPVLPGALGLPDGARTRLLVDHDGLFRVYCAENLTSTIPISKIKGALKAAGDEALLLMHRGGGRFVVLHTTAEGEGVQAELDEAEVTRLLPSVRVVGGEDPYEVSERVRELVLHPEEEREAYQNKGLFSDDYLKHRLTDPRQYAEWREDVSRAHERLLGLYGSKKEYLDGLNEAQTENEFLDEALEILGHTFVKQTKTEDGSRPDYALFGDVGTKDAALQVQGDPKKLYATSLAVVEGKYWARNLDVYTKEDDKDNEATASQKSSPEMQIARYLQETELSWGILTNGSEWRLYHGGAPGMTKRHYSVDLVRALESEDPEAFRRFYLFFRRDAFVPKGAEGKSFLDRVHTGSEEYAVRVGNNLKKVIFERLFVQLAAGFLKYHGREMKQAVDEEVLKKTYRGTLALLYRLLFLLYAEARDLLPHRDRLGYGVHSITRLKRDVAARLDEGEKLSDKSYVMWERLESLFRIVDGGSPELNVPPYNGGLFKNEDSHEFLGTHRVSDRYLAPALDELSRQEIEGDERRFVDYAFVGVRELGSVYEGLLEFSLRIADEHLVVVKEKGKEVYVPKGTQKKRKVLGSVTKGDPYLVNDKKERKATGAYYTPRYIVDYIVRNTLGPLVEERREALETWLAEITREDLSLERRPKSEEYRVQRQREAGALQTLLDVKVLDPAMGSGHFLVAAVDYLTDEFSRVISELDAEPVVEELTDLRAEIRKSLEAYGASATDEQLSDANLLKRMVLKRCVYGVDLNEMAVELAKLSLWLDAFTVGAPLSFLDHHLKYGNSLIGSSVREVRRELEGSNSLSGTAFEGLLSGAETMHELEEIPDATIRQVRDSASLYAVADKTLDPMKRVMDVWTSQHFKNAFAETVLRDELSTKSFPELKRGDLSSFSDRGRKVFETATELRRAKTFFHWELEFPEVFHEGARQRENSGFDAVVGNPPYDVLAQKEVGGDTDADILYYRSDKRFEPSLGGKLNYYKLFTVAFTHQARRTGRCGLIIPLSIVGDKSALALRKYLLSEKQIDTIDCFPQKDNSKDRVFEDAKLSTCVILWRNTSPVNRFVVHTHPGKRFEETSRSSSVAYEDVRLFDADELNIPNLNQEELNLILRLTSNPHTDSFGKYADVVQGEINLTGDAQHISTKPTKHKIIRGAQVVRYRVSDKLSQGEPLFLNKDQFLTAEKSTSKAFAFQSPRIVFQRNTGVDDARRIHAALLKRDLFAADSLNFISISSPDVSPGFLLSILNSTISEWRFRLSSTNNHVNAYEIKRLPTPRIRVTTSQPEREAIVEKAVRSYESREYAAVSRWVEQELSWVSEAGYTGVGRNDTVHDLLAHLAMEMLSLHKKRVEIDHTWQQWVEAILPPNHKLTKTFLEQGWIEIGLESGWEGVKAEFQARNAIPSGKALQDLRSETEEALEALQPLNERIQRTDELIDQVVYRLYGLTEDEIAVVETSVAGT